MLTWLCCLAGASKLGHKVGDKPFFDTVRIDVGDADKVIRAGEAQGCNPRQLSPSTVTISLDETTRIADIDQLFKILNGGSPAGFSAESLASEVRITWQEEDTRPSENQHLAVAQRSPLGD